MAMTRVSCLASIASRGLHTVISARRSPGCCPLAYWRSSRQLPPPRYMATAAAAQHSDNETATSSGKTSNVTPPVRFHAIDDAEGIGRYSAGGYLPVTVGDRLGHRDRYRVVHKLGHGSYSTVWLARDAERPQNLVAIKVCTADTSPRESDILSLLGKSKSPSDGTATSPRGKDMIPSVLDEFLVSGPHGTHTCLVTTPARSSVAQTRLSSFNRPFRLDVARAIAAQVILAISYVHSKGVVHGDLHLGNVLLKMPLDFARLSDEELYEEWGEPELEPVTTFNDAPIPPGVPSHAVLPIHLVIPCDELLLEDAHIVVADFGEAFLPTRELKTECNTPTHCRPPECRFEPSEPRSLPSDIWTLACSVWGIIGQRSLFEMMMSSEDDTTVLQVDALGKPPDEWWERWDARLQNFTEDGRPKKDRPDAVSSLESEFEDAVQGGRRESGMDIIDAAEEKAFFSMLRPMLAWRPGDRCSIRDVVESEWMTKWAMPDYNRIRS